MRRCFRHLGNPLIWLKVARGWAGGGAGAAGGDLICLQQVLGMVLLFFVCLYVVFFLLLFFVVVVVLIVFSCLSCLSFLWTPSLYGSRNGWDSWCLFCRDTSNWLLAAWFFPHLLFCLLSYCCGSCLALCSTCLGRKSWSHWSSLAFYLGIIGRLCSVIVCLPQHFLTTWNPTNLKAT